MSSITHPEHEVENSLTSPADRDPARTYKPNQGHRSLTETEVENAMIELNNMAFTKKFLYVERQYADPVEQMQRIGLVSFVPAKGATPNADGVYGFAKLRGNYPTEQEANQRAEFLIRNVDSYHQIYHTFVGRPFPLTVSSKYSAETSEVDIRKSMSESISSDVKNKKMEELKQIKEIEQREKELVADTKRETPDPLEHYTTLKVKKAQITWTYLETLKKVEEMKQIIIKTRAEIAQMDTEDATYSDQYFKKYCDARSESGLDMNTHKDNFMQFLVEDAQLDF
jgi:hypothetical protein